MESKKTLIKYTFPLTILLLLIFAFLLIKSRYDKPYYKNVEKGFTKITFETNYLPPIDTGHYVLWGIDANDEQIIIKRFNYYQGKLISLNNEPLESITIEGDYDFEKYEITVEKVGDRDEKQSGCTLLRGVNENNQVYFSLNAIDLSRAAGSFLMATLSDGTSETNEKSGIWFVDSISSPSKSLNLPELPSCWTYSAYLIYRDDYLRVGNFKESDKEDSFSEFSQTFESPIDFPGEDFLRGLPQNIEPPINVSNNGNILMISLEPDDSYFRLKTNHEPFWPILKYEFKGEEQVHTSLELDTIDQPQLNISIIKN